MADCVITDISKAESPFFVGLIKSSSLSLYCPSREGSGSVGSSIRALDRSSCDCGTRESDLRRIATRAANASAAADYHYHEITDGCTGESVASTDSRPNSIVRIRKSRSQGPAFRNLGDDLRFKREFVADGERFFYFGRRQICYHVTCN